MGQSKSKVKSHNESVLKSLEPADLISIKRKGGTYSHWAMYLGDEMVIHLTGREGNMNSNTTHVFSIAGEHFNKAVVQTDKFWDVVKDCKARKNNKNDKKYGTPKMSTKELVETAYKMAGKEVEYNALLNNCEHFAHLWRYGVKKSNQAENAITVMLTAAGAAAGAVIGAVIGVAGAVIIIVAEK